MKKNVFLLSMLMFSLTNIIFADTSNVYKNLKKNANDIVSGVSTDVKSAISHADSAFAQLADSTQFSFGSVYKDLKNGIESMGKALKVGATHVYEVLVKQQLAKSILWLVVSIITMIVLCAAWKLFNGTEWKEWNTNEAPPGRIALSITFWIIGVISLIVVICHLDTMVYGFVNPEYGAMKDIVDFVNQIKNGQGK
ncbi:MAG: hypothetical protein WAV23_02380 [Minisyncoccia bacterium]